MGNTWNGMTFTNIARTGFTAFLKKLAPLGVFSTDLSSAVAEQGTVVNTRIVPASAAAVDLQSGVAGTAGDREDANIIKDVTTSSVAVTLNQEPIAGFALTDQEAAQIGSGVWEDTKARIITTKAYAVANYVLNYCFNLMIPATYTNTAVYTGAAANFDMDDVVDAADAVAQLGWDSDMNSMVLDTSYGAALKKDAAIQDLSASGLDVVQSGNLRKLDRFQVLEAPTLRDASTAYTSNDVRGFVCKPSAMAIAMRATPSQATDKLVAYEVLTDPVTGATLVYRCWYKESYGKLYHTFETLFGAAAGQVTALSLIKSA